MPTTTVALSQLRQLRDGSGLRLIFEVSFDGGATMLEFPQRLVAIRAPIPLVLTAPDVIEADPISLIINMIKPITAATVVVPHYQGMRVNDKVTMIWEGTAGAGSVSQTKSVLTLGPVSFTVSFNTIVANAGSYVSIYYQVESAVSKTTALPESARLRIQVENPATLGTGISFDSGATSYYQFSGLPARVNVPSGAAVGTVLVSAVGGNSAQATVFCPTDHRHQRINMIASQPSVGSITFATNVKGVGMRFYYDNVARYLPSGPDLIVSANKYNNHNTFVRLEFVKVGAVVSGTVRAGVLANWELGQNRFFFMGMQLMSAVEFVVQ
ncbi:hypothetical protein [Pseudomonas sp. NA-150]|uniref:hypothetical protein n=1 Tax=Pseudomonas sp. NA-150 TaxID=3367525 RepID=UPI0037CB3AD7